MTGRHGRSAQHGFSMLELIIVVVIALVVGAIAIPGILNASQNFKLRSTASSFSGLVQRCRSLAVSKNGAYSVTSSTSSGVTTLSVSSTDVLVLPQGFAVDSTGGGFSTSSLNLPASVTTPVTSVLPQFNARGLPCFVSSGVCRTDITKMYITYLRQDRPTGGTGWAAITLTPAGRATVFTWNGSSWQ